MLKVLKGKTNNKYLENKPVELDWIGLNLKKCNFCLEKKKLFGNLRQ